MTRPVVLSASSVNSFLSCEYQYFLSHIECRPETQNVKAAIGIAVHEGAAVLLRAKMNGLAEPWDEARYVLINSLALDLIDTREDPKISPNQAIQSALACLAAFRRDILPDAKPEAVEEPFQISVDGAPFSGILDWAELGLHDLKTTASRPSNGDRYDTAMTGYAMGFRELLGRDEAYRVLNYLVRTKQPYHWPIRTEGPVTDEEIDRFAATVGAAARGIAAGNYRPTGLEKRGVCAGCGHRETCEPYAALREMQGESDG